jgi:hypothetical protein
MATALAIKTDALASRVTDALNRWRFEAAVQGVLATPPLRPGDRPFAALSMVQKRDVAPYLLAIKSFARQARPGRIVVVADPTLDEQDRAVIRWHVPGVEIRDAAAFRRPAVPVGGTWERLCAIAEMNQETSVVQIDADTVTLGYPHEVIEGALAGQSFVLRPEPDAEIVDLASAAATGREILKRTRHVQAVSEARIDELDGAYRYVRGCSGFTGFGRGALTPDGLDAVSAQMRALHGARWDEWGTEQIASNLLAASAPGAFMLPHPRYCNGDGLKPATVLVHFIGYLRFKGRDYERCARQAIRALAAEPESAPC